MGEYAVKVKRETWKDGHFYSVARNSLGHIISWRRWHGKESTEKTYERAAEIIVKKQAGPRIKVSPTKAEYKAKPVAVERYEVIVKMTTTSGRVWYAVYQSRHKHLTESDKAYIRKVMVPKHRRLSRDSIYDERVAPDGIEPVLTHDLNTGDKVYYA